MICFLTSSPCTPEGEALSPANGFRDRLRACLPRPCAALYICSDPDGWEKTDYYAEIMARLFEEAGFDLKSFVTLDRRNQARAPALVRAADLIILTGGHVPTQNRFFAELGLRELLQGFDGVLVGISAGSMNCAETVYAQPEEEGEAVDPSYQRFFPGLGLTKKMILPHYQEIRNEVLDGLRVMEDIAYPDSFGREIFCFPDGTYLYIENGREAIRGEAWLLADGKLTQISRGEITIRPYTEREIPDVLAFERELRAEENVWGWEIDDKYISDVKASFRDERFKNSISLLAWEDGKVIGRIDAVLIPSHFDGSVKAYLDWICVLKSCRHKGAAQALLAALRDRLKALGVDTLVALTAANEEAQRFYKSVENSEMHDVGIWIDVK